jgi:GNAT superfamily N-acetyltransferase
MEPTVRVGVTVTFLRMDRRPADPAPGLPEGATVVEQPRCSVAFYRYLYDTVGAPYVWWLRRAMPDAELAAQLHDPRVSIHVLYLDGEPVGFCELDARAVFGRTQDVNLSYFGLMPQAVGRGMGYAFLRHAVDMVWAGGAQGMTVNTCTADHPRALPSYLRAGFRVVRRVDEVWDVPLRLGLRIPDALRV